MQWAAIIWEKWPYEPQKAALMCYLAYGNRLEVEVSVVMHSTSVFIALRSSVQIWVETFSSKQHVGERGLACTLAAGVMLAFGKGLDIHLEAPLQLD